MLASDIAAYETQTHDFHLAAGRLVAGTEGGVPVFDYRPGTTGHYYNSNTTKQRIVLHFTAGYLGGDLTTLTSPTLHVSVSYVIGRNGNIYRLFPSEKWSYHTGSGTIGGNTTISKSSIGIEISNIGYLQSSGGWLWNYYGDRYCRPSDTSFFQTLPAPFRGEAIYASYTAGQYVAVKALVAALCAKHAIPKTLLPVASRYVPFGSPAAGQGYRGVCSHVNYRASGKWDIGPAFDWGAII
ncbi:MAG: N-acetylmuramoyl-L-alanine amidase [Gemmobacter sp.]